MEKAQLILTEKIQTIYSTVLNKYDFWLSPSDQSAFWAEFGQQIYIEFLAKSRPKKYPPPEIPGFEGTKEKLDKLTIRK